MRRSMYAVPRRAVAAIAGAVCAAATLGLFTTATAAQLAPQHTAGALQQAPGTINIPSAPTRKALAAGAQPVVYVSQTAANRVLVYPTGTATAPTQPIETIYGLNGPSALAVDVLGNLYVVETTVNDIKVFAPGKMGPSRTLTASPGAAPFNGVAVDAQGTVIASQAYGGVCVFQGGSNVPTSVLADPNAPFPLGVSVDAADNVYVNYISPASRNFTNEVGVFAASTSVGIGLFRQLPLTYGALSGASAPSPGITAIDANGDLLAYNSTTAMLGVYPRAKTTPSANLQLAPFPTGPAFALTSGNRHLYVGYDNAGFIAEFAFPTGSIQQTITLPTSTPYSSGIATSPPSPLAIW